MRAQHGNGNGNGNGNMGAHHGNENSAGTQNGTGNGWQQDVETDPIGGIFTRYFHEGQYLQNKVDALNAQSTDGKIWTAEEVREACAQAGMTPREHFSRFGAFEKNAEGTWGINPSGDFDLNAYYDAKSDALIGAGHNPEHVAWMAEQFKTGNIDPLTHFGMYGRQENMTPTSHIHGCQNPEGCWMTQQDGQQTVEVAGTQPVEPPVV